MTTPSPQVAAWADRLATRPVAVLAATRETLARCREQPDRVDANGLAHQVLQDPLMSLRVLAFANQKFGERLSRPVETVTAALVLLGIEPFFRACEQLDSVEERLAGEPLARAGLFAAVQRHARAARLAAAFAVHRQDEDAEVLQEAALLTGFSGLLLWTEAPQAALKIAELQRAEPPPRSADAQRAVLGTELAAIEQALMARWGLPSILHEMNHAGLPAQAGPRTVALAVRIARHAERGWSDPALPDDYAELGRLLHLGAGAAQALVMEIEGAAG